MYARNVILITIDACRADHLSCVGYTRETTPFLDQLSREGVLFKQCIAQGPHTPGAMPSLFSSTYPFMFGGEGYMEDKRTSVAEMLASAGYATAGIHSNPFLSRYFNHQQGYDYFYDHFKLGQNRWLFLAQRAINVFKFQPYLAAEKIVALAERWLSMRTKSKPFYLWLHFMDVHGPYQPPPQYQKQFNGRTVGPFTSARLWRRVIKKPETISKAERQTLLNLYDGEIRYTDEILRQFFERLHQQKLLSNTVVAITADHGEEFGEHSGFAHLRSLYDEVLRVPLILWGNGIPATAPLVQQVRLIDVVPTLLDRVGLQSLPHMTGSSLLPMIMGKEQDHRDAISEVTGLGAEAGVKKFSLRRPPFKLIRCISKLGEVTDALFDLNRDPLETHNILSQHPDVARALSQDLEDHLRRYEDGPNDTDGLNVVDDKVKQRLADLGYLDV